MDPWSARHDHGRLTQVDLQIPATFACLFGYAKVLQFIETGVTVVRRFIDQFEEIVASGSLIVVVASVCWGVISRYITEQPAAWAKIPEPT